MQDIELNIELNTFIFSNICVNNYWSINRIKERIPKSLAYLAGLPSTKMTIKQ